MTSLQEPEANSSDSTFLLHGVFAVRDRREGYAMVEVQQGVITGIDPDSITVTSPDGFAKRYQLAAERVDEFAGSVGSRVTVMVDADGHTLVEIGEVPPDGSASAALIPISRQRPGYVGAPIPPELPSAASPAEGPSAGTVRPGTSDEPPTAAR